jgi:hypothetical protein
LAHNLVIPCLGREPTARVTTTEVATLRISRFSFGSFGTKCHLDVNLMNRHIVYYKGEGGGYPQVRAMVTFVSLSLPVAHFITKSVPAMH